MCGRYALYGSSSKIQNHFGTANELGLTTRFNIAPSQIAPVVRVDAAGNRVFINARWGLVPSWLKDPTELQHPINAKSETAAIKPMFRHAYRKSRVLVPADAFYEWVTKNEKQPYLIRLKDSEPMGLGGLLEYWQGPEGETGTFTILTINANPLMAKIHERMPVIIKPEHYGLWLDTEFTDVLKIQELAQPYPERLMESHPVSRQVNSTQNNTPDLISAVAI